MNSRKKIQLKLYGALRQYGVDSSLTLEVPAECQVSELRRALAQEIKRTHPDSDENLRIEDCAFADASRVFSEDELLKELSWVAVLPPVCGG